MCARLCGHRHEEVPLIFPRVRRSSGGDGVTPEEERAARRLKVGRGKTLR